MAVMIPGKDHLDVMENNILKRETQRWGGNYEKDSRE